MSNLKKDLPSYTLGEELMSSISHGVGALFGALTLVLCVAKSVSHGSVMGIVASAIFGASMIVLYSMSTLYHALGRNRAKAVFRVLDHCSIYFLIAGTYTPYTLVALKGALGWTLFGIVWGAAILGITLNAVSVERFKVFSMICYLCMGWVIIFAIRPLLSAIPWNSFLLLLWGGIAYTVGAVVFGFGKKMRYIHSVWHFFVLAGSILHFLSIYLYIL
ncbi:MAG: hemolysin III family protein [Oscillospiraceae bacterium]|nr:hemolysin III family protein [Oscillospiraceae bacterium]